MSRLFVPPRVARQLAEESRRHEAEVLDSVERDSTLERWDREMHAISPYLTMVKAKDWVRSGSGLRPGFYHVIVHPPGAPVNVITIEGDNGEFVNPNDAASAIFEKLRRIDLQRQGSKRELREYHERIQRAESKARAQEREERQAEIMERYQAGNRVGVSMNRASPWTQNARGRRSR